MNQHNVPSDFASALTQALAAATPKEQIIPCLMRALSELNEALSAQGFIHQVILTSQSETLYIALKSDGYFKTVCRVITSEPWPADVLVMNEEKHVCNSLEDLRSALLSIFSSPRVGCILKGASS